MSIYSSKLWISDLDEIVSSLPELKQLAGKTVMITGCTGLICSAVADVLIRWNETHEEPITILAAGRSIERIQLRFSEHMNESWFVPVIYDATSADNDFSKICDYIIHGASNASPNKIIKEPVETMISNFIGMKYLLDYAKRTVVKRVLFVSSSEVYGKKEGNKGNHEHLAPVANMETDESTYDSLQTVCYD